MKESGKIFLMYIYVSVCVCVRETEGDDPILSTDTGKKVNLP